MRDGWRTARLGQALTLDIDRATVHATESYPLAGVFSFGRGLFGRDVLRGSRTSYAYLHRLRPDQLVMSKLKAWEGAFAIVPEEYRNWFLSPEFPTYTINRDYMTPTFLSLVVARQPFWKLAMAKSKGMGGRKERVNPTALLDIELTLPPLTEQRRIVDLAESMDRVAAGGHATASSAEATYFALLAEAFDRRAIEARPLGDLCETRLGKMLDAKRAGGGPTYPYIRNADVQWDELRLEALRTTALSERERSELTLRQGDLLVCEGGEVGRAAVLSIDLPGIYYQKAVHRVRCGNRVLPRYLMHYLRYAARSGVLADYVTSTTISHLTGEKLRRLPVPVPETTRQAEVASLLDSASSLAKAARAAADASVEARTRVLEALLTGAHEIPEGYDALLGQ